MKKAIVGSVILGMVLISSWVLMKHPASDVSASDSNQETTTSSHEERSRLSSQAPSLLKGAGVANNPAPAAQGPATISKADSVTKSLPPKTAQELKDFHTLHGKTFLTQEEEKQKQAMIQNPTLIRELGSLLSQTAYMSDPQFEVAENAALDLLLESFQKGDRETSLQVMQSLIQDAQVENGQLPQSVRETLAGIKGELLYNAVALAPQEFKSTVQNLPGPVSQRIWQNVQEKHRQNLAESQLEVQEHASKAGHR